MLRLSRFFFPFLVLLLAGCKSLVPTPANITLVSLVGDSDSAPLFWTNSGTNPISVDLIDLNGDASFGLTGMQVTPGQIAPGGTTPLVSVKFAPTAEGTFRATAIPSSLSGQDMDAQEANITGYAIYPMTVASPYMVGRPAPIPAGSATHVIDFGDIVAGTTAYRTVTLTNRNAGAKQVLFNFASNGPFTVHAASTSPQPIWAQTVAGANGQFTIVLQFAPQRPGSYRDALTIWSPFGVHFVLDLEGRAHLG